MDHKTVLKAQEYICAHLEQEFTLDELAHSVGYSAFHFAREFREISGKTVMEYTREKRVAAACAEIGEGAGICRVAMKYGFDTHAGFTKAFHSVMGCSPREYAAHVLNHQKREAAEANMDQTKLVIRPVCKDDVQDLWENVYSAMTPRQITEVKILPAIERERRGEGIELVAQQGGKVVMSLPMIKPFWIPMGFLFDNNFILTGGEEDTIMGRLLDEMKRQCMMMHITTLISPQRENTENITAFRHYGFSEGWKAGGWVYLAMSV